MNYIGKDFLLFLSVLFRHDSVERVWDFLKRNGFSFEFGKKDRGDCISAIHPLLPYVEVCFLAYTTVGWRWFYYDEIGIWFYDKFAEDSAGNYIDFFMHDGIEHYFYISSFFAIRKIKKFLKKKGMKCRA